MLELQDNPYIPPNQETSCPLLLRFPQLCWGIIQSPLLHWLYGLCSILYIHNCREGCPGIQQMDEWWCSMGYSGNLSQCPPTSYILTQPRLNFCRTLHYTELSYHQTKQTSRMCVEEGLPTCYSSALPTSEWTSATRPLHMHSYSLLYYQSLNFSIWWK